VEAWSRRAEAALDSGAAFARFLRNVEAQGGDRAACEAAGPLAPAPVVRDVHCDASGTVRAVEPRPLGLAVIDLGGGREKLGDEIDASVGFEVLVRPGDEVRSGQTIGRVHLADEAATGHAGDVLRRAVRLEGASDPLPLVVGRIQPGPDVSSRPEAAPASPAADPDA